MRIMSDKQFEGHTPAEQWTTYPMGADNPYHAVRIGGEGLDLPITKGADARLIAAAPELLAENIRLEQKLRGLTIAYDSVIDSINDFIETDYVSDDGADYLRYNLDLDTQYDAEEFGAEGDNSITYQQTFGISRDFASFMSSDAIVHGWVWSPQEHSWIRQMFQNETEYVMWVQNQFNKYIQGMIDGGIFSAEEFGADMGFYDKVKLRCSKCGDEGGMTMMMKGLKDTWDRVGYDDYESIHCPMCGKGVELVIPEGYNEYGDKSYDAEEFGAEFSKGDLKKLKKYIDFPTRWINKETAPTSETKRRKAKNKFVGTLPAQKGIEGMKYDIKTPTWFKGIQLGILATIFGAMYVGETKKKGKK